jgi:oligosaccharide repeat unit polymerase
MQDSGNISISKDLLNSENLVPKIMEVTEGANVMILLNIIKDLDSSDSYLYGETLIRPISYFIPKIIYQNRIKSFTVLTSDIYENNEEGSLSSTILGELYYNFSYFSIIFYLFLTYFFYKISYKFMNAKNNNFLFLFSSSVFIIFMARSVFSDNIIYILMLFIFSKLLKPSETY